MEIDRLYASEILTEASKLISQVRKEDHGESFEMTAKMWSAYLGIEITEADFCILMALMKITRQKMGKKLKDHYLDGAAYMALAGSQYREVPTRVERRSEPPPEYGQRRMPHVQEDPEP